LSEIASYVSVPKPSKERGGEQEDNCLVRASQPFREAGPYKESSGGILRRVRKREGDVDSFITNFTARIVAQALHDDGAEQNRFLEISARLDNKEKRFRITAHEFPTLTWVMRELGAAAYIAPGVAARDHVRAAIQLLSGNQITEHRVYAHMGWREVDGEWLYLHAGGAIGRMGIVDSVSTDFFDLGSLKLASLPSPPAEQRRKKAIRAALSMLHLGPLRITAPLVAAIWRSTLGDADFALWLTGLTGVFKSELAALAQQHWGKAFHAKALPGSWMSTANANENYAFAAKDAIFTIDDFAPEGSRADIDRLHREAARLLRAQGNNAGRGRLRADGSLSPAKMPRSLILGTGEDLPRGESIRARCLVIDLKLGDIDSGKLSAAQREAKAGRYAEAMSAWLQWLATSRNRMRSFADERDALRESANIGGHSRTPRIAADLIAAMKLFIAFALDTEAMSREEAAQTYQSCKAAIVAAAKAQAAHHAAENPVQRFLDQIGAALATGEAHLAHDRDGSSHPPSPQELGWRREGAYDWRACGEKIGWTDGITAWLEPSAAYRLAQKLATQEGAPLGVNKDTLWRRMGEANALAMRSPGRNMHEKKIAGQKRKLIALSLPIGAERSESALED
jgi:hypothetical protein